MYYFQICFILYIFVSKMNAQDGCRYMETNDCEFNVICTNFINTRSYDVNNCYYRRMVLKVQLSYTETPDSNDVIPISRNHNIDVKRYIVDLNLSNNNFESTPHIDSLSNLASLNFSHNRLNSAQFYNKYELQSLTVLDLSHNVIAGFMSESGQDVSQEHDNYELQERKHFFRTLLYLNISNNYLTSIPIASFDSMSTLKWLDLSHNFIDILDVMSFEGIKRLEHLDLSHNRIIDLNSALLRFTELKELYLNDNSITKLDVKDFKNLIKLRILDLKHNSIKTLDRHIFFNMANLNFIDLSYNFIDIVFDEIFSTNSTSLDRVNLSYNKLDNLPIYTFKGKQLSKFSIEGNKIEGALHRGIFDGLQNVDILNLSNQNLSSVDNYAFFGCNKLTVLVLKNNELTSLEINSMRLLNNLVTLDISKNKLQNIDFDKSDLIALESFIATDNNISHINKETFANLTNLQYLHLSDNGIAHIEKYSFQSLLNLINLQIFNNPLNGVIEEGTFEGLKSLPELNISQIQLSHFNNNSCKGMNALKRINLSSNNMTNLEYNAFYDAINIEVTDLSNNSLTTFHINPSTLPNLNSLILDHNKLTTLTSTTFQRLQSLTKISVSNNNLKFIEHDSFRDQTNLQSLDMSYNPYLSLHDLKPPASLYNLFLSGTKADIVLENPNSLSRLVITNTELTNINKLKLINCGQMVELDLSCNQIAQIEGDAFFSTVHLQTLDVSFNKLSDIKPGVFRDNEFLYTLNMSHNSLVSLKFGTFRRLQMLNTLDLSYNFLTTLKGELFYEVPSLKILIIDYNNIQNIDAEEFAGFSLTRLSIGDNPLPCEALIKLKKRYTPFTITSIKPDHQRENVDGITCNRDATNYSPVTNVTFDYNANAQVIQEMKNILENNSIVQSQNIELITDVLTKSVQMQNESVNQIKNLLANYSMSQSYNSDVFSKLSIELKEDAFVLHNASLENAEKYLKQSSSTNSLLEKILSTLTASSKHAEETNLNVIDPQGVVKDNNLTQIVQNWQNTISTLKTNILKDMDQKLEDFYNNHSVHFDRDNVKPTNQKLTSEKSNYNNSSLLFLEICTCLSLIIMVGYILYKLYKSNIMRVHRRRSESTRNIVSCIESSNL